MRSRIRGVFLIIVVLITGAVLGSWISQWMAAPDLPGAVASLTEALSDSVWQGDRVTVRVENQSGVDGAARSATDHLRDARFDVVWVGNGETWDRDSSVVRNWRGDEAAAQTIAALLGIARVESPEPEENLYQDVTVVLGKDWSPESLRRSGVRAEEGGWPGLRQLLKIFKRPGSAPAPGTKLVDPETE